MFHPVLGIDLRNRSASIMNTIKSTSGAVNDLLIHAEHDKYQYFDQSQN